MGLRDIERDFKEATGITPKLTMQYRNGGLVQAFFFKVGDREIEVECDPEGPFRTINEAVNEAIRQHRDRLAAQL